MKDLFYMIPESLAQRKDLNGTDKLVLAILMFRMNKGETCNPGIRRLAEDAGISRNTVCNSLKRLEACGDLLVERGSLGQSSNYRLTEKSGPEGTPLHVVPSGPESTPLVAQKVCHKRKKNKKSNNITAISLSSDPSGKWQGITDDLMSHWRQDYPGVDLDHELQRAAQWLRDNPDRHPVQKGYFTFLENWFAKAMSNSKPSVQNDDDVLDDAAGDAFDKKYGLGNYAEVKT